MKRNLRFLLLAVLLALAAIAVAAVSAGAASGVTDSDWLEAPPRTLVKCPGGDCDHTTCDYVYSFAVIGDTQQLNYRDVGEGTDNMKTLYRWIVDNRDSKNIRFVMGLGDITQSFNTAQERYAAEWPHAAEAIALLDEAGIPYSLVRGNHDISDGMNGVFGKGNAYYAMIEALAAEGTGGFLGDFLDEEQTTYKVESTWRIVSAGEQSYLILALDYQPTEVSMQQSCALIEAHPECRVIVTLHEFIGRDGAIQDDQDSTFPYKEIDNPNWYQIVTGGDVYPRTMWETFRRYENLEMILCGHIDVDDLVVTQMLGDHGNTVTCLLTNSQTIDQTYAPVGMITMLYIAADGSVAHIEHLSSVRAAAGEPAYLKANNQKSVPLSYDSWTETAYGSVPTDLYEAHLFHLLVDDDGDPTTERAYLGGYDSWPEAALAARKHYDIGSAAVRKNKTLTILLSGDYDGRSMADAPNTVGQIPGTIELDLGGHSFTLGSKPLLRFYNNATGAGYEPCFRIRNGNILLTGAGIPLILQTTTDGIHSVVDLEGVNFSWAAGSAAPVVSFYPGNAANSGTVSLTVTDCGFDASASGKTVNLFTLADTNNNNHVTLLWRGGQIKAAAAADLSLFTLNEGGDVVLFGAGGDGNFPTLTLAEATAPEATYVSENHCVVSFGEPVEENGLYRFAMVEGEEIHEPIVTPYGTIPDEYADAQDYPIVLFVGDSFVAAFPSDGTWSTFMEQTRNKAKRATLLLRRDYNMANASFANYSTVNDLLFDLDGHDLTIASGVFMTLNRKTANNGVFAVKNGDLILSGSSQFLALATGSAKAYGYKTTLTFEGVGFRYAQGATAKYPITCFASASYTDISYSDVFFNDCRVDLYNNVPSGTIFLYLSNDANNHATNVVFNGGSITAKTSGFAFAKIDPEGDPDAVDTISFGKGADGTYTAKILPSSAAAPAVEYPAVGGAEIYYAKGATAGGMTTYHLVELVWGAWTVTTAATCTEAGVETRANINDPARTESRDIPAAGHIPAAAVQENRVEPTYEADGSYDLVVYCSVCRTELSREQKTIDKLSGDPEEKPTIDVWLIAGQSNAAGYGSNPQGDLLADPRYTSGFTNVLYYGIGHKNLFLDEFVPVRIGLGLNAGAAGAEIGIASVVGNSAGMSAVIKVGVGSTYLYPNTTHDISREYGTWTSPSYIARHNIPTEGTKTGALYLTFLQTVGDGLDLLRAEGYEPVVRGILWMQGEAETGTEIYASAYEELIETLIADMRADLGRIAGEDFSELPFVMSRITRNREKDANGNFTG